jgi:predicted GNAT family N-acyltransferase
MEPLASSHDRDGFSCGVRILDDYIQKQASQDFRKHAAVPFILTPDGTTIAGYYTLSQYSIQLDAIPLELVRKLPRYPILPATLIGRLAVSLTFRGQGHGVTLLMDALYRSFRSSQEVASSGVIVDAKDSAAFSFYRKYGFLELPRIERRLFLPMRTIFELFD